MAYFQTFQCQHINRLCILWRDINYSPGRQKKQEQFLRVLFLPCLGKVSTASFRTAEILFGDKEAWTNSSSSHISWVPADITYPRESLELSQSMFPGVGLSQLEPWPCETDLPGWALQHLWNYAPIKINYFLISLKISSVSSFTTGKEGLFVRYISGLAVTPRY